MSTFADELAQHLQAQLKTSELEVIDESAAHAGHQGNPNGLPSGTHVRVRIASPLFTHQSRVGAHRLVYDACRGFLDRGLHALSIEILK